MTEYSSAETVKYPPFVDVHVHFRQPGTNDAETIATGSHAALMGGYQYVFDMPNNPGRPTYFVERVYEKHGIAAAESYVNFGAYAGWQPDTDISPFELKRMAARVVGKKDYLTRTTGNETEWRVEDFMPGITAFHQAAPQKPNMVHAANRDQIEQYIVDVALGLGHHVHICHINDPADAELVALYRNDGAPVSSGLTVHHAVKTSHDVHTHGLFAQMMPPLAPQADTEKLLWQLDQGIIDIVETDHAPHAYETKMEAELEGGSCFGVPSIELAFRVLRYQVERGRLREERLINAMSTRPAEIMGIKLPADSYSEWAVNTFRIEDEDTLVQSKAGWTPFLGQLATGRLQRVVHAGQTLYDEAQLIIVTVSPIGPQPYSHLAVASGSSTQPCEA